MSAGAGQLTRRLDAHGVGDRRRVSVSMSLRQRDHDRTRPALHGDVEGARDQLGNASGVVDLDRPFGHRCRTLRL